jgi:hypothetical protein
MPYPPALVAIIALVGALLAAALCRSRPRLALGILFLLASFSRGTLETPLGTMRPEMPAVACVAVVLLLSGRMRWLARLSRVNIVIALCFAVYLVALAGSSAFLAPGTAQSLRMVAWLAISMTGGVVACTLALPRPAESARPFALVGAFNGGVGLLIAVAFLVVGPFDFGVQETDQILPRVYALGWESNLYANFLVMVSFFAFEWARRERTRLAFGSLALIMVGFPLGVTRASYVALLVGAIAYVGILIASQPRRSVFALDGALVRAGALSLATIGVGVLAAQFLLPNPIARETSLFPGPRPTALVPDPRPTATLGAPGASPNGSGGPVGPRPTPSASPEASLAPYPDTIAFRLERVPIALQDLASSPWFGLGAESFGQRHPERYAGPGPDHIAILAVAAVYEAGILGAGALATGFVVLLLALARSARRLAHEGDGAASGLAAAMIGSLVSVLVAYQLNNALQLAINWIVIGAAMALLRRPVPGERPA